jgi:hypothetical protein
MGNARDGGQWCTDHWIDGARFSRRDLQPSGARVEATSQQPESTGSLLPHRLFQWALLVHSGCPDTRIEDEEPNRSLASLGSPSSVDQASSPQDTTLPDADTAHRSQPVAKRAILLFTAQAFTSPQGRLQDIAYSKPTSGNGRRYRTFEGRADEGHEGSQFDKEAVRTLQGEKHYIAAWYMRRFLGAMLTRYFSFRSCGGRPTSGTVATST